MYNGNKIGVVVPAYNEESKVGEVIKTMPDYVDRVYPVDDCSTDGTRAEIRTAAERQNRSLRASIVGDGGEVAGKRVVPITHEENRGVGGAIKTGYDRAIDDGMDIIAVMGGDGQMEPSVLADIVDPIAEGKADYSKGNRFLYSSGESRIPPFRLFGNYLLSILTKIASGYWRISDSQNGFTAVSREALQDCDFHETYEFYGYCNDLLVKLNVAEKVVADVPAPITYENEESDINYHTYIPRVAAMLLRNTIWRLDKKYLRDDFHPLVLLYVLGTVICGKSLYHTASTVKVKTEEKSIRRPYAFLVGILCFVLGMAFDGVDNRRLNKRITE